MVSFNGLIFDSTSPIIGEALLWTTNNLFWTPDAYRARPVWAPYELWPGRLFDAWRHTGISHFGQWWSSIHWSGPLLSDKSTLYFLIFCQRNVLNHLVTVEVYRSALFSKGGFDCFDCFDCLRTEEHARFIMQNSLSVAWWSFSFPILLLERVIFSFPDLWSLGQRRFRQSELSCSEWGSCHGM